jgi:hypothetical protein
MLTAHRAVSDLTADECWTLLGSAGLGRLATAAHEEADVFPLNFLVGDRTILFRTAPGSKLDDIARAPRVAFEADGVIAQWHWSVVVHGIAVRLTDQLDVIGSGVMELVSWTPTDKYEYVRITPDDITGRRIDRHSYPHASLWG